MCLPIGGVLPEEVCVSPAEAKRPFMLAPEGTFRDGNVFLDKSSQLAHGLRDHPELLTAEHDGKTLLAIAAEVGNLDAMRVLLDCGADPLVSDGSALHQAAFFGQTTAVELLLDAGVPIDCSGEPAVEEDPDDPYEPSAEERAAQELSRRQYTPLTWTILYSHYETAILLLRRGAAFEGPLSLLDEGNHHREPGFERVDPLVAGLAMVIPLADQRKRALERGAAAEEEERGVVMRVEDGPSERRELAA